MSELENKTATYKYIQFVTKLLSSTSHIVVDELFYLFENGYISNGIISAENVKEAFFDMYDDPLSSRTNIRISQFKKKGSEAGLFNIQKVNKKRNVVINPTYFTTNGIYRESDTSINLCFKNGVLSAHNPNLSNTALFVKDGLDGSDYYNLLTTIDNKRSTKDVTILPIVNLFNNNQYTLVEGKIGNNKDYLKVGFKYSKNLKDKLLHASKIGFLINETNLLFSLNEEIVPNKEWLNNFNQQTITIRLTFKDKRIIINRI